MILKAFDKDCGIITVDSLEDVYKVAKLGTDDAIKDYSIEQEGDLLTVTYVTANDNKLKFAIYENELDVELSEKPSAHIYLGGHAKLDAIFNVGQSYSIHRNREDGAVVLKGDDGKGYAVPQKFIDFYFEPSSESSRFEGIKNEKSEMKMNDADMGGGMEEMPDIGGENLY